MTNLLTVLPEFDISPFTHLLPSLERALISTADLLTLEALDVAKRAQVPPGEVQKLSNAVLEALQAEVCGGGTDGDGAVRSALNHRPTIADLGKCISTLDDTLDAALGGGIANGYLTEIVGER